MNERRIRDYALHLALMVRRQGNALALFERYDQKKKIGTFRSWSAVERAIEKYGADWLRDNPTPKRRHRA